MTQPNNNPAGGDVQRTVDAVVRRERRRIRFLAAGTITLWVLTALLIPSIWMPMAAMIVQEATALLPDRNPTPVTAPQVAEVVVKMAKVTMTASGIMLVIALLAELLAAMLTVWLVLTIRRVTLRQVSDSLAEISEQLRRMQRGQEP